ncbi:hypothetical protein CYMTET_33688 [Cymbomonas tetramitiformis]|uniref:Uncharacterized protein n=1 Tax=Cymbomonas tetramitiformis TaxID=36881 RepID=A0AAE0FCP9_9CHLO|nr:hypothetical protein CYMTET_33688 [Cymbomonas tetramitiformis]
MKCVLNPSIYIVGVYCSLVGIRGNLSHCSAPEVLLYALDTLGTSARTVTDKGEVILFAIVSQHVTGLSAASFEVNIGASVTKVQQVWNEECVCPPDIQDIDCDVPAYYHITLEFAHGFVGATNVTLPAATIFNKHSVPSRKPVALPILKMETLPVSLVATYQIRR